MLLNVLGAGNTLLGLISEPILRFKFWIVLFCFFVVVFVLFCFVLFLCFVLCFFMPNPNMTMNMMKICHGKLSFCKGCQIKYDLSTSAKVQSHDALYIE